ncbi:MAG: tetratricopeptide repeat protein, partial [Bacteroidetes bacterium]|nr:tetratricopeptide repeat protein [Bacteroidota bacterium]
GVRARIYYMRGMTYRMDGNVPAARQDFLAAREAQPGDPYAVRAAIEHAVLLAEDGDADAAVSALTNIATARVDAIGAEAQYRQGMILRNAGRLPEAEEALMRVGYVFADAAPWNARALLMLGKVSEEMEKNEAAREHYRKVIQQFAGSREAEEARTRLEMIR